MKTYMFGISKNLSSNTYQAGPLIIILTPSMNIIVYLVKIVGKTHNFHDRKLFAETF